jgi:hypothetical protein
LSSKSYISFFTLIISGILFLNFTTLSSGVILNESEESDKHDFHVSIIDVNHNQEKNSIEVSLKVFIDDLEKALTEENKAPKLFLNTKKENQKGDTYIKAYLNKHFKISIDGEAVNGSYLGKEYENDVCWMYVEYTNIKKPKSINIQNSMLLETYSDQANIIHFKSGTTKHSKALQSQDFIMSFNL